MAGSKIVAVDLGGTNLRVALVQGRKVLKYLKKSTPKTQKELLALMVKLISELMGKDVKAIGVGSAGPLKGGVIKNPPNLPLKNFNLKKFLSKKFKRRVEVGNDADCVALAESVYGVKKKNFLILTLGTGIGGGIIIDNKLYSGGGYAGEVGQIIVHNGKTWESYWKEQRNKCVECFGRDMMIKELFEIDNKNKAKKILKDTGVCLGEGIASLIQVLDPEIVVLMGGARETGKKFLDLIRYETHKKVSTPKKTPIVWSRIAHPGILGASLLVVSRSRGSKK